MSPTSGKVLLLCVCGVVLTNDGSSSEVNLAQISAGDSSHPTQSDNHESMVVASYVPVTTVSLRVADPFGRPNVSPRDRYASKKLIREIEESRRSPVLGPLELPPKLMINKTTIDEIYKTFEQFTLEEYDDAYSAVASVKEEVRDQFDSQFDLTECISWAKVVDFGDTGSFGDLCHALGAMLPTQSEIKELFLQQDEIEPAMLRLLLVHPIMQDIFVELDSEDKLRNIMTTDGDTISDHCQTVAAMGGIMHRLDPFWKAQLVAKVLDCDYDIFASDVETALTFGSISGACAMMRDSLGLFEYSCGEALFRHSAVIPEDEVITARMIWLQSDMIQEYINARADPDIVEQYREEILQLDEVVRYLAFRALKRITPIGMAARKKDSLENRFKYRTEIRAEIFENVGTLRRDYSVIRSYQTILELAR